MIILEILIKVTLSPPYLSVFTLSLGLLSPTNPSVSGICKGRNFFNPIRVRKVETQHLMHKGSKLIGRCVHTAVKIYVAAVKALRRRKERQDETQFTAKIDDFLSFFPLPLKR